MSVYMEVQPLMLQKRMEEMTKLNPEAMGEPNSQPTEVNIQTEPLTETSPSSIDSTPSPSVESQAA